MASTSSNDPDPAVQAYLERLKRADEERRGLRRKLTDINIEEASAVDYPAHLAEGWLVLKSADVHQHRPDVMYLEGMSAESARHLFNTDTIPAGSERPIGEDGSRSLGRSSCGCLYFRSPESVAKAASDAYVGRMTKATPKRTWTAEEAVYLSNEANKLFGRG